MTGQEVLDSAARLRAGLGEDFRDGIVASIHTEAGRISRRSVSRAGEPGRLTLDRALDRALTHRVWGFAVMGLLFFAVFWFTIVGAAGPSGWLYTVLVDRGHPLVRAAFTAVGAPAWVTGLLVDGVYLATAWVIAVMLPPMAVFFPLFTLLEDFGYLPRVAFNLDRLFSAAGAHGKQSLTMMMGYGCNAAGVTSTRIIDSPRERLIAIITNNFSVCNGRWPTLILMGTIFIGSVVPAPLAGAAAASAVVVVALLGIGAALVVSWGLSRTVLRGQISVYALELPPYRPPRVWSTLYTSLVDRTLLVLRRAVVMAAPAGAVIWLLGNADVAGSSLASHAVHLLDPFGLALGLNGIILLAYVVAIPANEIVIPTVLMLTLTVAPVAGGGGQGGVAGAPGAVGAHPGVMLDLAAGEAATVLTGIGGWTLLTAVNLMLFSLLHNPCSTTILTIWRETRSPRWTAVATLLPLALGVLVCLLTATAARLLS